MSCRTGYPRSCYSLLAVVVLCFGLASSNLAAQAASETQCWRGWGYWVDGATRAYKSEELLLVSRGDVAWNLDRPVTLYLLDRSSGEIRRDHPPIVVVPPLPRAQYNGRVNYVDGLARVEGASDQLVFGLSQIAPPTAPLPQAVSFNRWMCGLGS